MNMAQDNENDSGAHSTDATSALFVSARKKQIEQQEAERREKEREEARLAAEAEVRRLEEEVEERRRKTEEEKKLAEEEAKRAQEEMKAKKDASLQAAETAETKPAAEKASPKAGSKSKKPLLVGVGAVALIAIAAAVFFLTREPTPIYLTKSGIDVSGTYYSKSTPDATVDFKTDGTLERQTEDGAKSQGTYSILGESVKAQIGETERTFVIVDAQNMSESGGDAYTKNIEERAERPVEVAEAEEPEEPAWTLNSYAILDSMANLDAIKLGVHFPKSELKLAANDNQRVVLQSLDARAFIIVQALPDTTKRKGRRFTAKEVGEVAKKFIDNYVRDILPSLKVLEDRTDGEYAATHYKAAYTNKNGEEKYFYFRFGSWRNLRDQRGTVYFVLMECDLPQLVEYQFLTERIVDANTDT
jgi:hypothetical protein